MKAIIFDIQHFSVHDGPGIRTTVFFKGCPLRCRWCHNPEGLSRAPELSYNAAKCAYCGGCVSVCPNGAHKIIPPEKEGGKPVHTLDRSKCTVCGECAKKCLYGALEISGKERDTDEIFADVMKDRVFYETSGGGITVSGGEPFAQPEAAIELLRLAKEAGIGACAETSGYCAENVLREAARYCDLFLIDYKESDPARHLEYTGVTNERTVAALKTLDGLGAKMILRCPIIPGLNDRGAHYAAIARTAEAYGGITEVNIEPYHPLGISKSENFGKIPLYGNRSFMDKAEAEKAAGAVGALTDKPVKVM